MNKQKKTNRINGNFNYLVLAYVENCLCRVDEEIALRVIGENVQGFSVRRVVELRQELLDVL